MRGSDLGLNSDHVAQMDHRRGKFSGQPLKYNGSLLLTHLSNVLLQPLQGRPVFDDPCPGNENSSSSSSSEFDGSTIIHAGGAGGIGQIAATGITAPCDAQPAVTSSNISTQLFILSEFMSFLFGCFDVEFSQ